MLTLWRLIGFSALLPLWSAPSLAQRTDDNATRQATDAFGKSVGDEQIGIYSAFDVRGFSAIDAGNVRLENLYFDLRATPNDRLVDSSSVHVGISAQGFAFPAPTGVADFRFRTPGDTAIASVVLRAGPFKSRDVQLDLQFPLAGDRLGIAAGASFDDEEQTFGSRVKTTSVSLAPAWRPRDGIEVIPFWSYSHVAGPAAQTLVFTAGDYLPPRIKRGQFVGQPWARSSSDGWNAGLIAKAPVSGFTVALGVFRSVARIGQSASDLLLDVAPDASAADRLIVIERDDRSASTSGELRVSRELTEGSRRHTLVTTFRGRQGERLYGGADVISLGPTIYGTRDVRDEPAYEFGPKTRDAIAQATVGVAYQLKWLKVGEFGLGVQHSAYRRRLFEPDAAAMLPTLRANPWLIDATAAIEIARGLVFYSSYTRGLEESPAAPDVAINRNEAPPAIRTGQADAGLRWAITDKLTAIAGVFNITKPYFNLDQDLRFRQLGTLRNRGIEASVAGEVLPGLSIVAGTLLLDPEVRGEEVAAGLIGRRPVGAIERHSIVNADYRFGDSGFSLDGTIEETGNRIANASNTLVVPPRTGVSVGGRYRFVAHKVPFLLRVQTANVFNTYGYGVGSSGFFVYNGQRRLVMSLAVDL
ncbi:hypothetical protein AVM11_12040 [Sphingomonas melonis TY]|uniref:TonB-dependent receptor-like beta-barrel domain-containing protein n=1 Tax=Sphingomonas melonis TY TaxID=621456 RepID=A0A175Y0W5_9SPHN|nr:TonB-dependent receptor [Sphingomonas melonis]KZB93590.1 hypothetical protein AVM11_12040 [Sphingomonas melonis TY]